MPIPSQADHRLMYVEPGVKHHLIETIFRTKRVGGHLHKRHLSDPARSSRLMMATALGYLWRVYLGTLGLKRGQHHVIHRTDHCEKQVGRKFTVPECSTNVFLRDTSGQNGVSWQTR